MPVVGYYTKYLLRTQNCDDHQKQEKKSEKLSQPAEAKETILNAMSHPMWNHGTGKGY